MSAQLFHDIDQIREMLARVRRMRASIGLVPTMGALHEGHGRLIETARRETDCVVVSVFVNPIQFDRPDDLARYPRTLAADQSFSEAHGADLVFAPSEEAMYPQQQRAFVEVARVGDELCGRFRPGHFRGVATVVLKLLNIIQPDRAYFGEKDAQQLAVLRRMTRDLNLPVEIVPVPTARDSDGLALSSRNKHLDLDERQIAPILFQALLVAQHLIAGGSSNAADVKAAALAVLGQQPLARVEYLEIVDPEDMQPVERIAGPVRVAGAIRVGSTRLIDNMLCEPEPSGEPGLIQ